jgi:hypothetical protein
MQKLRAAWRTMRWRCSSPKSGSYPRYGGRGISVCKRWHNFDLFASDVGLPPFPGASLDRRDNDGDYEPGNCRWATRKQQSLNTVRNVMLTAFGETKSVQEWTEDSRCSVSYHTLYLRTQRHGWSDHEAITTSRYGIKHPKGYANAQV